MNEPARIYTDGGVVKKNPSVLAGTWAWCWVDSLGKRTCWQSGVIEADERYPDGISNNITELAAALLALESAPAGWSGCLCTDSEITARRIRLARSGSTLSSSVPMQLQRRLSWAINQVGNFSIQRLAGHPNQQELAAGCKRNGDPVSEHNVFCDVQCTKEAKAWVTQRQQNLGIAVATI